MFDIIARTLLHATYSCWMRQQKGMHGAQREAEEQVPVQERRVNWDAVSKRLLKAELARAGITYKALARRLEAFGIADTEAAIANRISRGRFSFAFFLQCMRAIGVTEIDLRDRNNGG